MTPSHSSRIMQFIALAVMAGGMMLIAAAGGDRPLRLAVLDPDRLRQESAALRGRMEALSAPSRQILAELQTKQAALNKALEEFGRQRTALSEEALRQQNEKLQAQGKEVQELGRRLKESMDKAESEGLGPMRRQVGEAVGELARERGIAMVLASSSVIYHTEELDLTSAVSAKLDQELKK